LEFIDEYTKQYSINKSEKKAYPTPDSTVLHRIGEIEENIQKFLPEKYRGEESVGDAKVVAEKYKRVRQDLVAQMNRRIEHWHNRLK
jgi:hypothetical protein